MHGLVSVVAAAHLSPAVAVMGSNVTLCHGLCQSF